MTLAPCRLSKRLASLAGAPILLLILAQPALGQEESGRPWENTAELGFVTTTGNTQTENLTLKNTFKYSWEKTSLKLEASMLNAQQTTRDARNEGGSLVVDETTEKTAESYRLSGKVRRDLRERLFTYGAASWERDVFAGIDSRYVIGAGLGYKALTLPKHELSLEAGADYTDEQAVGDADSETYAGARAAGDYLWKFSDTAKLSQELELLYNLEESDDYRINSVTSVTAALTSKLALKTSYTLKYDNQPIVEVLTADGFDPVVFEFDKTDTILSASLVINF
jgi:putative salt-induced outer membrane protein